MQGCCPKSGQETFRFEVLGRCGILLSASFKDVLFVKHCLVRMNDLSDLAPRKLKEALKLQIYSFPAPEST
ncbi:hypothetical protein L596_002397 [Steinernema carpocapsae]|uniref:Uncharacterized protein n=1 Tax=Steinernema carpocapsae TaxID=34508 RepID=A0A4U8UT23_STECR|nr:hypothetical protein L596_002397 [Steinernema carpocapsae]